MAENEGSTALFAQVVFQIVQSDQLQWKDIDELASLLRDHGGVEVEKLPEDNANAIALDQVTHIISTTTDFPEYEAASEALKAVVKPDWVSLSIAKGRLANPRQYSPDPRLFFSGLTVCCADLPQGDSDAIIGGVLAAGGLYSSPVTKLVTHIVALTIDNEKCQAALSKNLKCKIVLPHWFDDCLKLGQRIDEGPYCLPDPELLRKKPEDRILEIRRVDLEGASSPHPDILPTPCSSPSAHRRQLNVFKHKKVMLSGDLGISSHLRGTIEDLIDSGGGSVTGSVYKADIFICCYRESLDYRIASRAGKDVGNLSWLYFLITHNKWTSPLKRLLHYPVSRDGLPGFKNFRISLSNYNGEARIYLENLAKAAGGEFTRTMKEDNTHLITAHTVSEKCDAAKEWNIHMVNHLWLEESYAKWQIQTTSNNRYTHFPTRTNLGEVVGRTSIDKDAVERFFFPTGSDVDASLGENKNPKPMSTKSLNGISVQSPVSVKVQEKAVGVNKRGDSTPGGSKEFRHRTEGMGNRTPVPSRFAPDGKENETPSTSGSRSAKDKAVAKLHDLAPDIALFQKESKRVGGVIHGGRRRAQDQVEVVSRKRSTSNEEDDSSEMESEMRETKRVKKSKGLSAPSMRLALSGYKGWIGNAKKEGDERTRLRDLGILITTDPATCTHLAAPNIVRTQKFICALAHAPVVLSTNFIDDCLQHDQLLNPNDYILHDKEGEKRIGHKLSDALGRARENKGRLLHSATIYCTEPIHGGFDTYKAIVEVNGGKCLLYRARAGTSVSARVNRDGDGDDDDDKDKTKTESHFLQYVYLVSGATLEESKLWPRFRQMVEEAGRTPRIVRSEWILNLALSQEAHWKPDYELTHKDVEVAA